MHQGGILSAPKTKLSAAACCVVGGSCCVPLLQAWVQASQPGGPEPATAAVWALGKQCQGQNFVMMLRDPWGLPAASWVRASSQVGAFLAGHNVRCVGLSPFGLLGIAGHRGLLQWGWCLILVQPSSQHLHPPTAHGQQPGSSWVGAPPENSVPHCCLRLAVRATQAAADTFKAFLRLL